MSYCHESPMEGTSYSLVQTLAVGYFVWPVEHNAKRHRQTSLRRMEYDRPKSKWRDTPTHVQHTWDICGRKQKSLGSIAPGCKWLARWHNMTPSRRSCARSNTWALSLATICSAGKIWHLINQSAHNFQSSFAILFCNFCLHFGNSVANERELTR